MKHVFIVGAGFSKAVHSEMPDLKELSTRVRGKCSGTFALPPPLMRLGDNIELWLTYLSQDQPWLKEYYNLQNRATFLHMAEVIGQVLDSTTRDAVGNDCPDWLLMLIKWWNTNKSDVITLNYDTLIERAAETQEIDIRNMYPTPLTDIRRAGGILAPDDSLNWFRLYKLHGSVNWYYSGAASFRGEVLYLSPVARWGSSLGIENEWKWAASDKVPFIVPPTTEKATYFQHETVRLIWQKASAALGAASQVCCIGYGLPETDLGIRFFLSHSNPGSKVPLLVVNKDRSVVKRYHDLLGSSYDIDDTYADAGAEAFVKQFVASNP